MDSATCLYVARQRGFSVYALSFRYGQKHLHEIRSATALAQSLPVVEHKILTLDSDFITGSALTGHGVIAKNGGSAKDIPNTYVPARNTIFLAIALGWAEALNIHDIFIGVNAVDYSGYPDCRPEFIESFEKLANLATKDGVSGRPFRLHAPLLHLSKAEIIHLGLTLQVDYRLTHSCYDPQADGLACGLCDSCRLRRAGFQSAGIQDPISYSSDVC
ncbi:MAG: 7-cyano-7-deazaguanine synthase QueC [Magnetococcus sp. DMHC-6]